MPTVTGPFIASMFVMSASAARDRFPAPTRSTLATLARTCMYSTLLRQSWRGQRRGKPEEEQHAQALTYIRGNKMALLCLVDTGRVCGCTLQSSDVLQVCIRSHMTPAITLPVAVSSGAVQNLLKNSWAVNTNRHVSSASGYISASDCLQRQMRTCS